MPRCTVIIPCYNEADRLDVESLLRYSTTHDHQLLFVNDGSRDLTAEILDQMVAADSHALDVVHLPQNVGKAEAVRQGALRAFEQGAEYVGYWDADLATPLEAIDRFVEYLDTHSHVRILMGSRVMLLGRRIERKPLRHYLGRIFATVASNVLKLPVYDTQCGAKMFRTCPRTQEIFQQRFLTKWLFDVELLARFLSSSDAATTAEYAFGIHEMPLHQWRDVEGSKVRPVDFVKAIRQLAVIRNTFRGRLHRVSLDDVETPRNVSPARPAPLTSSEFDSLAPAPLESNS